MGAKLKVKERTEPMTIDELRAYPGLGNLTDMEAEHALISLTRLAVLMIKVYHEDRMKSKQLKEMA